MIVKDYIGVDNAPFGVGRSSGGAVSTCNGFDHPIEPTKWMHLQFRLFSVSTSGPQRLWYVMSCLWESAYIRSLTAYWKAYRR